MATRTAPRGRRILDAFAHAALPLLASLIATYVLAGCRPAPVEIQKPAPEGPAVRLETRTDTVAAVSTVAPENGPASPVPQAGNRFMIQIGAYHDPERASEMQAFTRGRCSLTVINDFDAVHTVYRIRIGFFDTREQAETFRIGLLHDFPGEYQDAWIVTPGQETP